MKKIYKNPTLEIIKIASQTQMLAGSEIPGGGETDQNLGREDENFDW